MGIMWACPRCNRLNRYDGKLDLGFPKPDETYSKEFSLLCENCLGAIVIVSADITARVSEQRGD